MRKRCYVVTAYRTAPSREPVQALSATVWADNSGPAIDKAEELAALHPSLRFVVSNDEGRNLYAVSGGGTETEYLGY